MIVEDLVCGRHLIDGSGSAISLVSVVIVHRTLGLFHQGSTESCIAKLWSIAAGPQDIGLCQCPFWELRIKRISNLQRIACNLHFARTIGLSIRQEVSGKWEADSPLGFASCFR